MSLQVWIPIVSVNNRICVMTLQRLADLLVSGASKEEKMAAGAEQGSILAHIQANDAKEEQKTKMNLVCNKHHEQFLCSADLNPTTTTTQAQDASKDQRGKVGVKRTTESRESHLATVADRPGFLHSRRTSTSRIPGRGNSHGA